MRNQALQIKRARVNANKLKPSQLYSNVATHKPTHLQLGLLENQLKVAAITAITLTEEHRQSGTYQEVIRTLCIGNGLQTPAVMKTTDTTLNELVQTLQALASRLTTATLRTLSPSHFSACQENPNTQ